MDILEFYETADQAHWLHELRQCEWGAGQFLYQLLSACKLRELCGESTKVYLLCDGDALVSFLTLAEQDDVRAPELTPWIGFVYTFPAYRGHRYAGRLLSRAEQVAQARGDRALYISTNETGLYEKYGYTFFHTMKDMNGDDSRIYHKALTERKE